MKEMAMRTKIMAIVGTTLVAVLALSGVAWAATALAVTKTLPDDGATGVARAVNVKAYFNHDMKASTLTSTTFKIRKQGTTTWLGATRSVNNTISPTSANGGSQSVATLNPNSDLGANTTYQVVVVGGSSGVKDLNGNALGANKSWTFTTVDTIAPAAPAITSPTDNSYDNDGNFTLSGTAEANSTVTIFEGATSKGTTHADDQGNWSKALSGVAEGSHTYTAKATDAAGNTSSASNARTVKVDTQAPSAPAITSPANNSFDTDGNITLSGTAEASSTVELFEGATSKGTTQTDAQGNWSKALSGVAEGSHTYTAKATDAAGNTSALSNARTLTVDTTAPAVLDSITPAENATGVGPSTNVTATFSEAMDPNTITTSTFTLKEQGSLSNLGATVSYDPFTKTATLDPTTNLTPSTTYTAIITTGVKDVAGNTLAQERSWTFTTDILRPTVVSFAPTNIGGLSTNVTATFSEAMDPNTITTSTFTLTRAGTSDPLAAKVTYDSASKTATLDPDVNLSDSTSYTAVIKSGSNGVKNLQGISLAQDFSSGFMACSGGIILPTQSIHTQGIIVCG
jgi:Bacterial Ig-like domain/Bacterial Ig domain